MCSYVSQK
uniref:Uncharacterized protein n=1 Tax=Anguilla anguilla TaxID=7936 RepID=A0A0E9VFA7_ANGAN